MDSDDSSDDEYWGSYTRDSAGQRTWADEGLGFRARVKAVKGL